MKKIALFISLLILFNSCSSDDSNSEFIVGKWRVSQRTFNDNEIELNPCDPVVFLQFKSDFSLRAVQDDEVSGNIFCGTYPYGLYYWEIAADGHYIRNHSSSNDYTIHYYKENNKLVAIYNSGNKVYYRRILNQ